MATVLRVTYGYINASIRLVFKVAEEESLEWLAKKQSEWGMFDNMSM